MTLRAKLVAALGLLSAIATLSLGAWTYRDIDDELRREIDGSIDNASDEISARLDRLGPRSTLGDLALAIGDTAARSETLPIAPDEDDDARRGNERDGNERDGNEHGGDEHGGDDLSGRPRRFEQILVQILDGNGAILLPPRSGPLPTKPDPTKPDEVQRRTLDGYVHEYSDIEIDGEPFRMLVAPAGPGLQIQVARSLAETERVLDHLRHRTLGAVALVATVAGLLGWLVARQITRRLTALTLAAEDVARTGRLDVDVTVRGDDEAGRLGAAFSGMLSALARSREDQQRLVQDAGHELRTPLTSLRTNIATLRRHDHIDPAVRRSVMDDLDSETRELTTLVNELVELATDQRTAEPVETVLLSDIARRAAERTLRRTHHELVVRADASTVIGQSGALERAVNNLVDNAVKFDVEGNGPIEIVVDSGRVTVNDRGPGIPHDDLGRIFDRFHRGVSARSRPGSGLGLSIVDDIVTRHGGTVFAGNRDGGGASIGFILPSAFQTNSHPNPSALSDLSPMMHPTIPPSPPAAPNIGDTQE